MHAASDKLRFVISIKQLFSLALARSQHSLYSAIVCTLYTINIPLLQITTQLCILFRYKSKQRLSYLINKIEYFCCLLNCSRSSQSGMTFAFNTTTNQIVNASTSSSVVAAATAATTAASTIIMIDTC